MSDASMHENDEGTGYRHIKSRGEAGAWRRLQSKVNRAVNNFYYKLGYRVAENTLFTLLLSLAFVLVCCYGFSTFTIKTDGQDLWVPSDAASKDHENIARSFQDDDESDFATLLFEATPDGDGNLLKKGVFDKLWEINAKVLDLETGGGNSFSDLCTTESDGDDECAQPSRAVTRFWEDDFSTYVGTVLDDEDLLESINVAAFPDGEEVFFELLFGNSITYEDGNIVAARAMTQTYHIMLSKSGVGRGETLDWLQEFIDLMDDEVDNYKDTFTLVYLTGRSIDDALEESVTGEVFLFIITYCIMITFVMIMIGRCCSGAVLRRSWLGLGGITLVAAAGLAAYGIMGALKVPFTSISQILPFILIGIGADDMFVIVASMDHTDPRLNVEERVALALKRCGVSITYTSLTNFLAFMLGSLTTLPAVQYFCLYAGTAILCDFLLQVTAFVALVTIDAKREKARRMEWCCCCIVEPTEKEQSEETARTGVVKVEGKTDRPCVLPAETYARKLSDLGRWIRDTYTPLILSVPGKLVVMLAAGGLLAAGVYGATQTTHGFDILDLAPDDHYARAYSEMASKYELETEFQYIPLRIFTLDVDYTDVEVQAQIQATDELMLDQDLVVGPLVSWLSSFVTWTANERTYAANIGESGGYSVYDDRDTFYEALSNFTGSTEGEIFLEDIIYTDTNTIEISRTQTYLIDQATTENNIAALRDARKVVGDSTLDPSPFAYSTLFVLTEQFLVMYKELITNFALVLVAVAVLSFLVLGHVTVVVLLCVTLVAIDVELLGFVHHWGLEVNSITVVELIMAVGLVVDYMVHIVHYCLHQDPKIHPDKRIAIALGEIGPSVVVGAATTFLGIMPIAFAGNEIFRVFFKMFLIIITFGLFHGVVFIPVALSLLRNNLVAWQPSPSIFPMEAVRRSAGG